MRNSSLTALAALATLTLLAGCASCPSLFEPRSQPAEHLARQARHQHYPIIVTKAPPLHARPAEPVAQPSPPVVAAPPPPTVVPAPAPAPAVKPKPKPGHWQGFKDRFHDDMNRLHGDVQRFQQDHPFHQN